MSKGTHRLPSRLLQVAIVAGIALTCVGVATPFILKVREANNKMICVSRLRGIGIAAHNYHNDYDSLPPGYIGPTKNQTPVDRAPVDTPWIGCLTYLLPYLARDDVYDALSLSVKPPEHSKPSHAWLAASGAPWWTDGRNVTQASWRLRMFRCPSDTSKGPTTDGVIVALHTYNCSKNGAYLGALAINDSAAKDLGWTNFVGVAGPVGDGNHLYWAQFGGVLTNRSRLSLGQLVVQDGTSNTLMFGETLGGRTKDGRNYAFSWPGCGAMGTYQGLGAGNEPPERGGAEWYRFSSEHAAVVHFCFADCSTRGVRRLKTATEPFTYSMSDESDWWLLQSLAGRKDGFFASGAASPCD